MPLNVGDQAPDFTLQGTGDVEYTLSSYRNSKNVVLVFYPGDDTPG